MYLLLRMILLILGILEPGIFAKYIELKSVYNIFPIYNFTLNFSNRNLRQTVVIDDKQLNTRHMSLLHGQMFGNDVSFYYYVWQTAHWDMAYSIFFGLDGCLFYNTLAVYFRKRFLCGTAEFVY